MPTELNYSPMRRAIGDQMRRESERRTTFADEHDLVEDICGRLERLADGLPAKPPVQDLSDLLTGLRYGVPAHCLSEEAVLRERAARGPAPRSDAVTLLAREHAENEAAILELAEALEDWHAGQDGHQPETIGYLARLVFTQLRRHMAWEEYLLVHVFRD